ncbi:hypothetical protein F3Y22_tig00111100pilonHSYRG00135 [Hibiscus syriacus]|uniref:Uncharacterized protein n=1 Tax=Hibiscus syriacus TaxID=106335 RepID=A0A6A2Z093_HIBSY|nr:hypothetical protein F3Y22_tig00111100pilonHSYRG00135 [Hibiscus syriacus]
MSMKPKPTSTKTQAKILVAGVTGVITVTDRTHGDYTEVKSIDNWVSLDAGEFIRVERVDSDTESRMTAMAGAVLQRWREPWFFDQASISHGGRLQGWTEVEVLTGGREKDHHLPSQKKLLLICKGDRTVV